MEYEKIQYIPRETAKEYLQNGDDVTKTYALLSIALHDDDWKWAQSVILKTIRDVDVHSDVKDIAILCLGHIVRLHRILDLDEVMPLLKELSKNPIYVGRVEDALDDIKMFYGKKE